MLGSAPRSAHPGGAARLPTRSFHRPLSAYVNGLAEAGLLVERMVEVPGHKAPGTAPSSRAADRARQEIPLFLGLRAIKVEE